jgi:hypothetical protein
MQNRSYPLISKNLSEVKESILIALAYFDLFSYPLTRGEVFLFLGKKYDHDLFDAGIKELLGQGMIFKFDKFYTLKNEQHLAVHRTEGNKKAQRLIQIAKKAGSILIHFPYVRGIAISGSLSKNFADDDSDIDFFIITAKNRLWIARTIMHCFKKLTFLVNKEHYFCMNYYVDEQQPEIAEKNIYTAVEIGTLIPLEGDLYFEQFYAANAWMRDMLPNKTMRVSSAKPVKANIFKWLFEIAFNTPVGNAIDNALMRITAKRWRKKTIGHKLNSHGQVMAMVSGKHFSKPDPTNFQGKLLLRYEHKVAQILKNYESLMVH